MKRRWVIMKNVAIPPKEEGGDWNHETEIVANVYYPEEAEKMLLALDDENDTYYIQIENREYLGDGIYDWIAEDDSVYPWQLEFVTLAE